jgi:hypothetical protein
MTQEVEIKCINKTNRTDPHERISHVGGVNPDGTRWKMTEDAAIASVENGTYRFWTQGGGKSVWVVIATSAAGHKYLKTEADGVQPNNLLALPECP